MAPTTNPDLVVKDAMYLLELLRDSPQPILLHIGPYAEKTSTKPNTIQKRLGTIKDRNGLNIITTTNAPGSAVSYTTPRPKSSATPKSKVKQEAKPKIKHEEATKPSKKTVPTTLTSGSRNDPFELEEDGQSNEAPSTPAAVLHGLPSPAESSLDTPLSNWTNRISKSTTSGSAESNLNTAATQMPQFMSHKRAREEEDANGCDDLDDGSVLKKVKTETWSFS